MWWVAQVIISSLLLLEYFWRGGVEIMVEMLLHNLCTKTLEHNITHWKSNSHVINISVDFKVLWVSLEKIAHTFITHMSSMNLFQHMTYVKPIVVCMFGLLSRLNVNPCIRKCKRGEKSTYNCCSRGKYWAEDLEWYQCCYFEFGRSMEMDSYIAT